MRGYLAIDQGGTKTEALLFRSDGEIIARGNDRHMRTIETYADFSASQGRYMRIAYENALHHANIESFDVAHVVAALSGADWADDYTRLRIQTADALNLDAEHVQVVNDCIGALRGGTSSKRSAVICIGTGMNAAVCTENNQIIYGYLIADCDQGGGAIGRETWHAMIDAETGLGEKTLLTHLVCKRYAYPDAVALIEAYTTCRINFAMCDLAANTTTAAAQGDCVAQRIIHSTAIRYAKYIANAMMKLEISNSRIPLVLSGGVTKGCGHVLTKAIQRAIKALEPNVKCYRARYEPVAGAALIELDRLLGGDIPSAVVEKFDQSARSYGLILNDTGGM
jgi:N-acetylglucosamine kinase-like BadF-type ATPase